MWCCSRRGTSFDEFRTLKSEEICAIMRTSTVVAPDRTGATHTSEPGQPIDLPLVVTALVLSLWADHAVFGFLGLLLAECSDAAYMFTRQAMWLALGL
jgi:hypothetical protein